MTWQNAQIPDNEYGRPKFAGIIRLLSDRGETLGSVVWFDDAGPYYAHAMDPNDTSLTRRIGPCMTLEGAKQRVIDVIEGRVDVSNRAGYRRE